MLMEIHDKNKKILRTNVFRVKFDSKYGNLRLRVFRTVNKSKLHDLVNFTLIRNISFILNIKKAVNF
jgi:hypothetical protein